MKNKIRGTIIGVAIGDALGMPTEGMSPENIKKKFGAINSYRSPKFKSFHNLKKGQWTDDTQLTMAIGKSIINNKGINFEDIAKEHINSFQGDRRGWGKATINGCQLILSGTNWWSSGTKNAAGNGPPMKISPIGILYGMGIINKFELINACSNISRMTHGDIRATLAAIAQAYLIGIAIKLPYEVFSYELEHIPEFIKGIEDIFYEDEDEYGSFYSSLSKAIDMARQAKSDNEIRVEIGIGPFVNESVAFTYAMLLKYHKDPKECIEKIIAQGGDADTTASIAGAILGAIHGYWKFPEKWRWGVEKRSELITLADNLFSLYKKGK